MIGRSMEIVRGTAAVALLGAAAGCGLATDAEPPVEIVLDARVSDIDIVHGTDGAVMTCVVDLQAGVTGSGGRSVEWRDAMFRWYAGPDRSVPVDSVRLPASDVRAAFGGDPREGRTLEAAWWFSAGIPFSLSGELAQSRGDAARFDVDCGPDVPSGGFAPPEVAVSLVDVGGEVEPGDVVRVEYRASSLAGLWQTMLSTAGAFESQRLIPERLALDVTRVVDIEVPPDAALGLPFQVDVGTMDAVMQVAGAAPSSAPVVVDRTPPSIVDAVAVGGGAVGPAGQFGVGDTVGVNLRVVENGVLDRVHYDLRGVSGAAGSVPVTWPVSQTLDLEVQPAWVGDAELELRVTDAAGLSSAPVTVSPGVLHFYPVSEPEAVEISFPGAARAAVLDSRGRLLVTQRYATRLSVLDLDARAVAAEVDLPSLAGGVDVWPDGDSAVVALPELGAIGVIDLRGAAPVLREVQVAVSSGRKPASVAVTADGRIHVLLVGGGTPELVELDAAGGVLGRTTLGGASPADWTAVRMARSGDRRVVAVWDRGSACLWRMVPDSGELRGCDAVPGGIVSLSLNRDGSRAMIGERIHDEAAGLLPTTPGLPGSNSQVISPDGTVGYLSTYRGIVAVRATGGRIERRLVSPMVYGPFLTTPDGGRLVTVGDSANVATVRIVPLD